MIGQRSRKINPAILVLSILLTIAVAVLTFLTITKLTQEHYQNDISEESSEQYFQNNDKISLEMDIAMSENDGNANAAIEYINSKIETADSNNKSDLIMSKIVFLIDNQQISPENAISELKNIQDNNLNDYQKARLYIIYSNLYKKIGDSDKEQQYVDLLNSLPVEATGSKGGQQ